MRILRMISIAVIAIALACWVNYLLNPSTVIDPQILVSADMHATVRDVLKHWKKESPVIAGMYCERIAIPTKSELRMIAPSCEFVRFYFRRLMILQFIELSTVTRRRIDLAIKKSTGESRVVLAPWGYDFEKYPEFLLWAGCRIESEADAEQVLGAMLQLREGGRSQTYARRDSPNHSIVGQTQELDAKPLLILETGKEGNVIQAELRR